MAKRPAWSIEGDRVISKEYEFVWHSGLAMVQKRKNIISLHNSISNITGEKVLEVSTKGLDSLGINLSAFSLELDGYKLESIYQSSKVYEHGGPYLDLLSDTPKNAKTDIRHTTSGRLLGWQFNGYRWGLEPKTAFYDYLYLLAVVQLYGYNLDLSEYSWFTDIEFNPKRSYNCQARAIAIYKFVSERNMFYVLDSIEQWLKFHSEYVTG